MSITLGQQIEEYKIVRRLGQGAFGTVYLAQDTYLDRLVAIKELTVTSQTDETAFKRFIQEARAAGNLNHPHIVTVHSLKINQNDVYLIMEYLPGGSLRDRLNQQGRLPLEEAIRMAAQVCNGLAAAHGKGIVHRDIKPENILLAESGQAKVSDFGIAHVPRSSNGTVLTQTGFQPGTMIYMPPEQIRGQQIDGRSDVYQVGVMLHEILTGQHYIDVEQLGQQARQMAGSNVMRYQARFFDFLDEAICEFEPGRVDLLRPDLPRWVSMLISAALAKQVDLRPSAEALAQALQNNINHPAVAVSGQISGSSQHRYCPECGRPVADTAKFCAYCGEILSNLRSEVAPANPFSIGGKAPTLETPSGLAVNAAAQQHFNSGLDYIDQGSLEKAISEFEAAARIAPEYVDARYNLALAYAMQERFNEACREFQAVLRLNPDMSGAHNNLGTVYEQMGQLDEAAKESI